MSSTHLKAPWCTSIYDVIVGYQGEIDFHALGTSYKNAIEKHDLQQLPSPFGLKNQVPGNVQMQIVIPKDLGGHHAILKHCSSPNKTTPILVKSLVHGTPYRAKWMTQNPSDERCCSIFWRAWEILGGRHFKCVELSSRATRKPGKTSAFDEKDGDEIDAGFDYTCSNVAPAPPENAQLRWQSHQKVRLTHLWMAQRLGRQGSPQFGDGALARKEFHYSRFNPNMWKEYGISIQNIWKEDSNMKTFGQNVEGML